jgi:hypothetical protein
MTRPLRPNPIAPEKTTESQQDVCGLCLGGGNALATSRLRLDLCCNFVDDVLGDNKGRGGGNLEGIAQSWQKNTMFRELRQRAEIEVGDGQHLDLPLGREFDQSQHITVIVADRCGQQADVGSEALGVLARVEALVVEQGAVQAQSPNDIGIQTLTALSAKYRIPASNFVRFSKAMGFTGFADLQIR